MSKEEYEKKLRAQLDKWKAEINELKIKADKAEADTRLKYHQQIEALNTKREAMKTKLKTLENSSGEAWRDLKGGIDKTWEDLKSAFKNAKERFK